MAFGLDQRVSLGWIALLRIVAGGVLLGAAFTKVALGFDAQALVGQLAAWQAEGRSFAWVKTLLDEHVVGDAAFFARLVVLGEICAGLSLVLGLASRVGALVALVLALAYFLASREDINLLLVGVHLAVLVTGAGRTLGLDLVLKRKWSWWFLG